jgi:hypothetical protein
LLVRQLIFCEANAVIWRAHAYSSSRSVTTELERLSKIPQDNFIRLEVFEGGIKETKKETL